LLCFLVLSLSTKLIMTISLSAPHSLPLGSFPIVITQAATPQQDTRMMMLSHAANAALLVVALLVALVSAVEGTFMAEMVG